jgi:hypothetical protein
MTLLAAGGIGGMTTGQLVMLGAAVIGLTIVMRSTFRRVTNMASQPRASARSLYANAQNESKLRRDAEQVMIELDQLARQVHGRLDTRFAKLEAVIRDADERIDRLSRLVREADGVPGVDVMVDDAHSEAVVHTSNADNRYDAVYRLADGGLSPIDIAQEVGTTTGEVELILSLRKTKARAERGPDVPTLGRA